MLLLEPSIFFSSLLYDKISKSGKQRNSTSLLFALILPCWWVNKSDWNSESLRILNQKFKDREIKKFYLCLVHGILKNKSGIKALLTVLRLDCWFLKIFGSRASNTPNSQDEEWLVNISTGRKGIHLHLQCLESNVIPFI